PEELHRALIAHRERERAPRDLPRREAGRRGARRRGSAGFAPLPSDTIPAAAEVRMGLLIKNGTVVTALDTTKADVYCDNGTVTAVGFDLSSLKKKRDREIDASGKLVVPGGIDAHTHMELPFMGDVSKDDFEQGTICGVAGGTTSIIDFVIP